MPLTTDQVNGLAPDAASAAAGRKLAAGKHWEDLGSSDVAAWGKCRGSAVYQVKVDFANFGYHCSCPSRKFPCKHVLGMLLLLADSASSFLAGDPPDWTAEWLAKREARIAKQAEKSETKAAAPVDEQAKQKRSEKREARIRDGIERLDLWLKDIVRSGLATIESRPMGFWDEQARRLVDAQAPALAARVGRLAEVSTASSDWPDRLLSEMGQIALLLDAYRRVDLLEPAIAADIRQLIGWNVSTDEVDREGERVSDLWQLVGQWVDDDGRVKTQRTWALGRSSGRLALLLQFAAGAQPFAEPLVAGSQQAGTLVFYPGAARLRARFVSREGPPDAIAGAIAGHATIEDFLMSYSEALARQPWIDRMGGVLNNVVIVPGERWFVADVEGAALPLLGRRHWQALAVTGGERFDLAAEWDGRSLRALAIGFEGRFWPL